MRLRALSFLLIALSGAPASAQWTWLHPKPQGHTLWDVEFLDASTAIAVGEVGTVVVTHDAGLTWSASTKTNGITSHLRHVAAIDAATAVAVGDGGVILRTTDAGASWLTIASGTTISFEDVDFAGPLGLAAGDGLMIRSTDGGGSWVPVLSGVTFHGVDVVTSSVAVAVADFLFLRSEDGGETWGAPVFVSGRRSSVSFSDLQHGAMSFALGLLLTADGGQTWISHGIGVGYSETSTAVTDIEMVSPQDIFLSCSSSICDIYNPYRCSTWGQFFRSANGGGTWSYEETWWRVLNGITVSTEGTVILVGEAGVIHRWVPLGTLEQTAGNEGSEFLSNPGRLAFQGPAEGMIVGGIAGTIFNSYMTQSVIARTTDSGGQWVFSYYGGAGVISDVAYAGASSAAYASAQRMDEQTHELSARLLKSTNGGATWVELWSDPSVPPLTAIAFSSATHGVAVGVGGTFAVLDHDAVSPGTIAAGGNLQDVAFADASTALAIGAAGLFRSIDGGASWNVVPAPSGGRNGIGFASATVGVAVGGGGSILRTTDGGQTWNALVAPTSQNLLAVSFATASDGLAVGANGTALETNDGGLTWDTVESPTTTPLTDVVCLAPHHAYVAGADLTVLEYGQEPVPTLIASFEVAPVPFAVELHWSVRDEADLSRFMIRRRSGDGSVERTIVDDLSHTARFFRDESVAPGKTYEYQLFAVDRDGTTIPSAPVSVTIPGASLELLPNQPNPFNPSTTIRFVVPERERVRLVVYDVAGRHVVTLVDDTRDAGVHSVEWSGMNAKGSRVASGVYVIRIEAGKQHATRKVVLLK